MSVPSSNTYENAALKLIELERDGQMTVEIFTALCLLLVNHSSLSARTRNELIYRAGLSNLETKYPTQEQFLGHWSTRGAALPEQMTSTPHSHSGCWCNSSKKQGTNDF